MAAAAALFATFLTWAAPGCPGEDLRPSAGDLATVKAAVLCLVNEARRAHGARPLGEARALEGVATRHARWMVASGRCVAERRWASHIRASGYGRRARALEIAENDECATLMLATPRNVVAGWLASPPHRANLLGPDFRASGIGVAPTLTSGQEGADYTQVFGSWR